MEDLLFCWELNRYAVTASCAFHHGWFFVCGLQVGFACLVAMVLFHEEKTHQPSVTVTNPPHPDSGV